MSTTVLYHIICIISLYRFQFIRVFLIKFFFSRVDFIFVVEDLNKKLKVNFQV